MCTCFTLRVPLGLSVCFRIFLVSGMFVLGGGRGVLARQRQFRLDISGNSCEHSKVHTLHFPCFLFSNPATIPTVAITVRVLAPVLAQ